MQFYLILATVTKSSQKYFLETIDWSYCNGSWRIFWRSRDTSPHMAGFIIGIGGWIYILYEVFSGEAGRAVMQKVEINQW